MKKNLLIAVLIGVVISSCKKDISVSDQTVISTAKDQLSVSAGNTILIVKTIAGMRDSTGPTLVDGTGKDARFKAPLGIYLANTGNLYVADSKNNAIRKVTTDGTVTTLVNPAITAAHFSEPNAVGLYDDGSLAVVDKYDGGGRVSVFKPDGLFDYHDLIRSSLLGLAWDPFTKSFYEGTDFGPPFIHRVGSYYQGYGIDFNKLTYHLPSDYDGRFDSPYYTPRGFFFGFNNIIYMILSDPESLKGDMFKILRDGTPSHIYTDLKFKNVTSIVANHDSRSIYIVDNGAIKVIVNGKLQYITGPNPKHHDSRDGVGTNADVYAYSLALSKDENTLYFTDLNANAVRKVILRLHSN
ncbi:hypothetical protein GS399_09645 [Pedobacter sp. HMF7647]|uniref:6-bladed beta-propeller n=1 Tax=Hufsiella arboris TaxID=2695275 RepID=A0A7K1YA58_9SPHI|nr:hypothetical protein [Hufsiella arboris]MXV51231.1 hypothetical protein [Hufsiella arboris]